MASSSPLVSKKRSWGKSREREKVSIVDQMEIEQLTKTPEAGTSETEACSSGTASLQHPHLMSDAQLENILRVMKVPLPSSTNEESRRDQLVGLYKKHVMPRPQRTGVQGKKRRKRGEQQAADSNRVVEEDVMDWTTSAEERDNGECGQECERKRLEIYRNITTAGNHWPRILVM